MTNVAWKNLGHQRARFALSIGGVAFAVMLILIVRGLFDGVLSQATDYARSADADLWVSQAGTPDNLIQSPSLLPRALAAQVEAVPGVVAVYPLVTRPVAFTHRGSDVNLFLVGVDGPHAAGWPSDARRRDVLPAPGEVVLSRVFAKIHGIGEGDALTLGGEPYTVAGMIRGGNAVVYQYGWAHLDEVAQVLQMAGTVSHLLVRTDGDVAAVAAAIEQQVPGVRARSPAALADAEARHLGQGFQPMLYVLVLIALAVGAATIGLIIYTATIERRREYAVLKAIGFSNRRLYGIVFQQSGIAASAGFAAGCVLAFAVAAVAEQLQPVFVATIDVGDVAYAAVATAGMAFVASFVPARPLARLLPAEAFQT